jgi:hypothetical protein
VVRLVLDPPGHACSNTADGSHTLLEPKQDSALQQVFAELADLPVAANYTAAIQSAADYVLDGAHTGRFDVRAPDVHPGERAAIGAKLEFEVISTFGWAKRRPLDTVIAGVPLDLKATVGRNWTIPDEAHCQLCLCTRIDFEAHRHRTWLIRAHRSWLYRGVGNKDGKRGIAAQALENWAVALYEWESLPVNPLLRLSASAKAAVFADGVGQEARLLALFESLPDTLLPRSVIETVCAGFKDPVRRARAVKQQAARRGLTVLCGTWKEDKAAALAAGVSLRGGDWIALSSGPVADTPALAGSVR